MRNQLAVDDVMHRIGKFDQDAMRSGQQPLDDESFAACIHPMPGRIVDRDVKMAERRPDLRSLRSKDRLDAQVVRVR